MGASEPSGMQTAFESESSLLLNSFAGLNDESLAECQTWMSRCVGFLRGSYGLHHPWSTNADRATSDHLDATWAYRWSTPNNRRRALDSCFAILQGAIHEHDAATNNVRLENTSIVGNAAIASTVRDMSVTSSNWSPPATVDRDLRPAFVSYMRVDAAAVYPIVWRLREAKTAVWIDHEDLSAGNLWKPQITKAIAEGNVVLAFLSASFLSRSESHMHDELEFAIQELTRRSEEGRRLIPVRLDATPLPPVLEDWHAIDWFADPMKALASIIGALR